ncbi:B-type cyclin [Raphidocelis subcapitata]|uniref:B-type cyclin n=1 Tax=Raphidocelis subcapitata TaxID=307507 RepID=A0A2V0NSI8_9CHLO|nr:B-type cyclin [Raphidocelis subcapitata]|eukprot:GBF88540.1 B-type cyclin [Raphidocelis subcapitata]
MPLKARAGGEENQAVAMETAKGVQLGNGKRRALGDVNTNFAGGVPVPGAGKDKAIKQQHAAIPPAAVALPGGVRVTRSQTRAQQGGSSLSALLQARSEATSAGSRRQARTSAAQQQRPGSPLPDIDASDRGNPLAACDYVNDVYGFYRRVEPQFRVPADYMSQQADINEKMRAILIDWLVEVHLKFKLMPETLFLAVALIDRYLSVAQVVRKNLQLVGVTAMLIAAKYEEIWAPEVRDFVYISDKAYDRGQILAMERAMLAALDYKLTMPTSYQYLARLLKAAGVHYEKPLALFVAYCAELCLVDYACLRFTATEQAAAIMYVAMRAFGKADPFPPALARHAHKRADEVLHVAKEVVRVLQRAPGSSLQAVCKKYATTKFCEASAVPPPLAILDE